MRRDAYLHPALSPSFLRLRAQAQDTTPFMFIFLILLLLHHPLAMVAAGTGSSLIPETTHGSLLSLLDGPLLPVAVPLPRLALDIKVAFPPLRLIPTPVQPHKSPAERAPQTAKPSQIIFSLIQAPIRECSDGSTSFMTPRKQLRT